MLSSSKFSENRGRNGNKPRLYICENVICKGSIKFIYVMKKGERSKATTVGGCSFTYFCYYICKGYDGGVIQIWNL